MSPNQMKMKNENEKSIKIHRREKVNKGKKNIFTFTKGGS
jgi:hypothetical protein